MSDDKIILENLMIKYLIDLARNLKRKQNFSYFFALFNHQNLGMHYPFSTRNLHGNIYWVLDKTIKNASKTYVNSAKDTFKIS